MDKRVYLLTLIAFIVGMAELIIGGILDLVAVDLNVSLGRAGLLITVFAITFALSAPILLLMTTKVDRRKLMVISLFVFLLGNVILIFSASYGMVLIARIISAASGSLLSVLALVIASTIVDNKDKGKAIGIVVMGVSGSIVFGIPIGLMLGNSFGWRSPFILIAFLTVLLMIGVHLLMGSIKSGPAIPLKQQINVLKSPKIFFAQFTIFLFLSGHMTFYAYFTPFLKTMMGLSESWVSAAYFIFGIAAVIGGGLAGILTDRFGSKPIMLIVITLFGLTMFTIPYTIFSLPLFLVILVMWGIMNWAITPSLQSYIIESAPETAAIQQSLYNGSLHLGIAFGSFFGGIVIENMSVEHNATFGALFVLLALGSAIFSITRKQVKGITAPSRANT